MSLSSVHLQGGHISSVPVQVIGIDYQQPQQQDMDTSDKALTIKVYQNNKLVQLNAYQILQITEIINAHSINTSQKIENNIDAQNEDETQFEYVLEINDTFLHSIFGDANAKQIKQIIDHKLMMIFIVILWIIVVALWFIFGFDSITSNVYDITLLCSLCIPWILFKHLLFNKVAFKLCIKTFDFWIKVGYAFMFSIAYLFHGNPPVNGFALINIQECIFSVWSVLIISYISSFDAVHSTKTKKLSVSVFAAVVLSYFAVESQFFLADEHDYKIMIKLSNGVNIISMQSLLASSTQIIAIFYWKQSYKTWKSKGSAVTIFNSPKITWIHDTTTEQALAEAIPEDSANTRKVPEIEIYSTLDGHTLEQREKEITRLKQELQEAQERSEQLSRSNDALSTQIQSFQKPLSSNANNNNTPHNQQTQLQHPWSERASQVRLVQTQTNELQHQVDQLKQRVSDLQPQYNAMKKQRDALLIQVNDTKKEYEAQLKVKDDTIARLRDEQSLNAKAEEDRFGGGDKYQVMITTEIGTSSKAVSQLGNEDADDESNAPLEYGDASVQDEILRDETRKVESLALLSSANGGFVKFVQKHLKSKIVMKMFTKLDPQKQGYIEMSSFTDLVAFLAILHQVKVHQQKTKTKTKPKLNNKAVRAEVEHLAIWIANTHVYDHNHEFKLTQSQFQNKFGSWCQNYLRNKGVFTSNSDAP